MGDLERKDVVALRTRSQTAMDLSLRPTTNLETAVARLNKEMEVEKGKRRDMMALISRHRKENDDGMAEMMLQIKGLHGKVDTLAASLTADSASTKAEAQQQVQSLRCDMVSMERRVHDAKLHLEEVDREIAAAGESLRGLQNVPVNLQEMEASNQAAQVDLSERLDGVLTQVAQLREEDNKGRQEREVHSVKANELEVKVLDMKVAHSQLTQQLEQAKEDARHMSHAYEQRIDSFLEAEARKSSAMDVRVRSLEQQEPESKCQMALAKVEEALARVDSKLASYAEYMRAQAQGRRKQGSHTLILEAPRGYLFGAQHLTSLGRCNVLNQRIFTKLRSSSVEAAQPKAISVVVRSKQYSSKERWVVTLRSVDEVSTVFHQRAQMKDLAPRVYVKNYMVPHHHYSASQPHRRVMSTHVPEVAPPPSSQVPVPPCPLQPPLPPSPAFPSQAPLPHTPSFPSQAPLPPTPCFPAQVPIPRSTQRIGQTHPSHPQSALRPSRHLSTPVGMAGPTLIQPRGQYLGSPMDYHVEEYTADQQSRQWADVIRGVERLQPWHGLQSPGIVRTSQGPHLVHLGEIPVTNRFSALLEEGGSYGPSQPQDGHNLAPMAAGQKVALPPMPHRRAMSGAQALRGVR